MRSALEISRWIGRVRHQRLKTVTVHADARKGGIFIGTNLNPALLFCKLPTDSLLVLNRVRRL